MGLLIKEPPFQLLPTLAVQIGINNAIFLQQLHYNLENSTFYWNGDRWYYASYSQLQKQFKFFSLRTLRRIISDLKNKRLIEVGILPHPKAKNKKCYRINYSRL